LGKQLFIESLEIRTDTAAETYRFEPGVNAITGPISSGKSSLLELIKYGLGGTALVMPAVRDNVRTVVLRFRAGDEHWEFTRALRSHVVQVYDLKSQESLGEWAATNRQNMRPHRARTHGGARAAWRLADH
jgi:DNA repair exonuclease SbcCD ATPase subunit